MGKANPVIKGGESEGVILYCGGAFGGSITTMANIEKELLKEILSQDVEEEVYAGTLTTTVAYKKAKSGTIPSGYEGIVMGVAVSYLAALDAYLKRKGKHVYADGLPTLALSNVAQAAGIGDEVPLLVKIGEKDEWELGFKGAVGTVNWRLRIRLFKKKAEVE